MSRDGRSETSVDHVAHRIDVARVSCRRAGGLHRGGGQRAGAPRCAADDGGGDGRKRRRHDHGSHGQCKKAVHRVAEVNFICMNPDPFGPQPTGDIAAQRRRDPLNDDQPYRRQHPKGRCRRARIIPRRHRSEAKTRPEGQQYQCNGGRGEGAGNDTAEIGLSTVFFRPATTGSLKVCIIGSTDWVSATEAAEG